MIVFKAATNFNLGELKRKKKSLFNPQRTIVNVRQEVVSISIVRKFIIISFIGKNKNI